MKANIALLPGDGIGPEIVDGAVAVLERIAEKYGHSFDFTPYPFGGVAIDSTGVPLPEETEKGCLAADCVLLGAVGGPKWDTLPGHLRPEKGLLGIRAALGLYANLRPVKLYPALKDACPLRESTAAKGFDILIVRELTGGIYFGERGRSEDGSEAYDTEKYSVKEIERIGRSGFEAALKRGKRLTSIDKANVLESSRLWRETMHRLAKEYPQVEYADMLVDNAAMQLVRDPSQFDVIVTSNMFGDILSDEASQLTGSIGMLPSSSLGEGTRGLYEPIHGSAPDIAGKGLANPIATILSAAMLLRFSLNLPQEAQTIEDAVDAALAQGLRTADIAAPGEKTIGTQEMTRAVLRNI
ncbi:MAG: 3-isopropylmalate dehydrogenase [Clostridium sp.]|jgi:3-isopropylmalate dehydrogenase|nr:3-isopropylmalate dehydrogenase [Clostridium sp.]